MGFFIFWGREKGERVLKWVNVKEGLERRGYLKVKGRKFGLSVTWDHITSYSKSYRIKNM